MHSRKEAHVSICQHYKWGQRKSPVQAVQVARETPNTKRDTNQAINRCSVQLTHGAITCAQHQHRTESFSNPAQSGCSCPRALAVADAYGFDAEWERRSVRHVLARVQRMLCVWELLRQVMPSLRTTGKRLHCCVSDWTVTMVDQPWWLNDSGSWLWPGVCNARANTSGACTYGPHR